MWPWPRRSSHVLLIHFRCGLSLLSKNESSYWRKNIPSSPFTIVTGYLGLWAVAVKNKCWWSSDVYNNIQVLLHIKAIYGHIIKARHYCLDWCVSWFQLVNVVLMRPYESRPSLWQTGELVTLFFFWGHIMTDCRWKAIKWDYVRWCTVVTIGIVITSFAEHSKHTFCICAAAIETHCMLCQNSVCRPCWFCDSDGVHKAIIWQNLTIHLVVVVCQSQ